MSTKYRLAVIHLTTLTIMDAAIVRTIDEIIDEIKKSRKSRKSCILDINGGIEELKSEGRR